MDLSQLKHNDGARHKKKRIGRGEGSGWGMTAGRGEKGYGSRAGSKKRSWFEGGQMPLVRRVPKRGFTNIFKKEYNIINLESIERTGLEEITYDDYFKKKLARKSGGQVKILGNGDLTRKIKIHAHKFSETALEKIKNSGGEAIIIGGESN